jgi:GT2 family glycosyltransferase
VPALAKLKNGLRILRSEGTAGIGRSLRYHRRLLRETRQYQSWISKYNTLTEESIAEIRDRIRSLEHRPRFSIIMPVYNTPETWLRKAIESVLKQIYADWELCIADDNSKEPKVQIVLQEYSNDHRIRTVRREENGHISAASNSALELASGDFVVLFDHDDELSANALAELAFEIDRSPHTNMIYSDEDIISESGERYMPKFKPDWSPELFYSMNLVTHLVAYRRSIVQELGGFRVGFEGSQDYDLALRVIERIGPETIRHIPRILYHWRAVKGSAASGLDSKPYAYERARRAINEHFERIGVNATSVEGPLQINRTVFRLPEPAPSVRVIVAEDSNRESILRLGTCDYPGTIDYITKPQVSLGERSRNDISRFALFNAAAESSNSDLLCFIHSSSRPVDTDWLNVLVGHALQNGVGTVGAKLLFHDGTIKHAGYVLGINDGIGRAHYRFRSDEYGNYMRLVVDQNFSAVSADCMVIQRKIFKDVGGFDIERFPYHFADIDLCLRLQRLGYRIVWTPWAEIIQTDEDKVDSRPELLELRRRWPNVFRLDPYYNPNLTSNKEDLSLAFPPRTAR